MGVGFFVIYLDTCENVISGLRNKLRYCKCFTCRFQLALETLSHISTVIAVLHVRLLCFLLRIAVGLEVPPQQFLIFTGIVSFILMPNSVIVT